MFYTDYLLLFLLILPELLGLNQDLNPGAGAYLCS